MTALWDAARDLALGFGWPVMPVKPGRKEPLTAHGVRDATVDERTILHWGERWPDANLAIACGAPGPQVLDVDDPSRAHEALEALKAIHPPTVATVRGSHHYFQGTDAGTISLPYGELRGKGSYVLCPPSRHPSGKFYAWLDGPRKPMPVLPQEIIGERRTAGTGEFEAPELIPHGQRHAALKDAAVRLLRGGFTDVPTLEQMLHLFYETRCVMVPKARPDEFRKIAEWATATDIARRERLTEDNAPMPAKKPKRRRKGKSGLEDPPRGDASLTEHREYLKAALGLPESVVVKTIVRHGIRGTDMVDIELSNGQRIRFDRQDHITTRGWWARTVMSHTHGIADPVGLTDWEGLKVFRSVCIIADTPTERRDEEEVREALRDFLALAEALPDHDLGDAEGRFNATAACRARPTFDPRKEDRPPAVLVDRADGGRYVRAGELQLYLNHLGSGISAAALAGRMSMIGSAYVVLDGREPRMPDREGRRTNRMIVYRMPEGM